MGDTEMGDTENRDMGTHGSMGTWGQRHEDMKEHRNRRAYGTAGTWGQTWGQIGDTQRDVQMVSPRPRASPNPTDRGLRTQRGTHQ